MGFFTGLATGLATSIDKKLQEDMEKTEDRIYEMQERGIVRARTKAERKEKETKELSNVLTQLAAFTGGDEERALQLYEKSGKTIDGATAFIKTLRANEEADKDVNALITYVEAGDPRDFESFIDQNTTQVTEEKIGEVKGAGIYGALFNPDFAGRVKEGIAAEVEFDKPTKPEDKLPSRMAEIDYSGFLSAEEAEFKKKERALIFKKFDLDKSKFDLLTEETRDKMRLAQEAQTLSEKIAESDMSEQAKTSARADAQLSMDRARLAIAQDEAGLRATQITQEMGLTDIKIETAQFELDKLEKAPQFATHEAMLVSADTALARLESKDAATLTQDEKLEMQQMTQLRNTALTSMKEAATAEATPTYTPTFSKQSIDSVLNAEIKRQLTPVGLYDSVEDKVKTVTSGNKLTYFTKMQRVFDAVEKRYEGVSDTTLSNALAAQRGILKDEISEYKNGLATDVKVEKKQVTRDQLKDAAFKQSLEPGTVLQYKNGDVTITTIWTGSGYI